MSASQVTPSKPPAPASRMEYVAAIVVNIIIMVVVNNLLRWNFPPFLTDDFNRLLWLINLSLGATIAVNLAFIFYARKWFKALCRLSLSAIALVLCTRFLQIFPFDFSMYESTMWTGLARVMIIIAIVMVGISIVVDLVKFIQALASRK